MQINLQEIKEYFKTDYYVQLSGIEIVSVDENSAVTSVEIGKQHLNAGGVVQGGLLYTMADFTFAVLANALHSITVTQHGQITYVRAAKTKTLKAVAREVVRAGRNCVVEVCIYDDQDQMVATSTFQGFIKNV